MTPSGGRSGPATLSRRAGDDGLGSGPHDRRDGGRAGRLGGRSVQIGLEPPIWVSSGANWTVANRSEPGSYRFSDTPTFTRDVDILPEGHRLVNGDAR
jgi:hypothetical protein